MRAHLLIAYTLAAAIATAQETRLTNIISSYPHSSPDGTRIVFHSNRTGQYQVFVMNADGSGLRQLTNEPSGAQTPKWSPDGTKIVYASEQNGNTDVWVMRADGTGKIRITDFAGDDGHPHWSADGQRIIFNSARTTPDLSAEWSRQWHEVFSVRLDGTDLRQHTRCRSVCTYPSFSPDGKKIAYRKVVDVPGFRWDLSNAERNSEVFVSDLDGSNEINLSSNAAYDGWPAWSPDSKLIAFTSNRTGPQNVGQVFSVASDGTGLRQVTRGPWSYTQPSWSPDGKRIYAWQNQDHGTFEFGDIVAIPVSSPQP